MKTVTLTRDMRPYGRGEDLHLPDDMADKLVSAGEAENPRPFPPTDLAPAAEVPARRRRQSYVTKGA